MRRYLLLCVLLVVAIGAVAVWWSLQGASIDPRAKQLFSSHTLWVLENPEGVEVLSLDPVEQNKPLPGHFHQYTVLGTTHVVAAAARKQLVTKLVRDVVENDGQAALCFDPRHGGRIRREGHTIDFVICYACAQVKIFENRGEHQPNWIIINATSRALLDTLLREAKVPLATR